MTNRLPAAISFCVLAALALTLAAASRAKTAERVASQAAKSLNNSTVTLDLSSFGAIGDGVTDAGPALQAALDALASAGGGTLLVPAGRYAVLTPVVKDFAGLGASVTIAGVPSGAILPPKTATGPELTRGLDLQSELLPKTGETGITLRLSGLRGLLLKDLAFVGTPGVETDAAYTLALFDIEDATVSHCEFYGLSSTTFGSDVQATRTRLRIERSVFLGCTANSGSYTSVVQNLEWKGFEMEDAIFADYGQRPELFSKTGLASPFSWVELGNASAVTNDSPRREAVFRDIFLDEGGMQGIASLPTRYEPPSADIDLVYVSNLVMNVSNLRTSGHFLTSLRGAMVENSAYGWSHNADSAINLFGVGHAILDRVQTSAAATRIRADAETARLTVIDSSYEDLASLSPQTVVINTTAPGEDPVQHVRARFESGLARAPDAAAHFYWSDQILRCGADAACADSRRSALDSYLASSPSATFAITGRVNDENDAPLAGVAVSLAGSQTVATTTDADGLYHFSNLPTSGVYAVAASKRHYTFGEPQTFTTPASDVRADFGATLIRHTLSGRVTDDAGRSLSGATLTLSGTQTATATTDSQGDYTFTNLGAGGSYTVTVSANDFAFAPASESFTDLSSDERADFAGAPTIRSITGVVVNVNNRGLAGINVTLAGAQTATTTTGADGSYRFDRLPVGGSYVVAPSLLGYAFAPASQSFSNLDADEYAGFVGGYFEHTISGRVTTAGGSGVAGVAVALAGTRTGATTTDAGGNYTLAGLPLGGDYAVSVAKAHYTFETQTASFTNLSGDTTADFAATLQRHAISGGVTKPDGSPFAGVTVGLTGTQTSVATTDAQGNYSFANLAAGGDYTVTPSLRDFSFSPASQSFTDLSEDSSAGFTGDFVSYRLSGRVTEKGAALAGVAVDLAGTHPLLGQSSARVVTGSDGAYSFIITSGGGYTVTPSKAHYTFAPAAASFAGVDGDRSADFDAGRKQVIEFGVSTLSVGEGGGTLVVTVTRTGDASEEVSAVYEVRSGTAMRGSDIVGSTGRVTFAPGETSVTFTLFITDDTLVEGAENFVVSLTPEGGASAGERATLTVTIDDNDTDAAAANAIDETDFFVRQQYRDFFARDPDAAGLHFWSEQIRQCGADTGCRDSMRVNVSGAFFLSIEFQETGFLVYKTYKAAYGRTPDRLQEFVLDSREIGAGVIVGQTGWGQRLEQNKTRYIARFVERPAFVDIYPESLSPAQFVSALNAKTGGSLTTAEESAAAAEFNGAHDTTDAAARARVLRRVVENSEFHGRETSPAFVLMQYFGYLRREPDEPPNTDMSGYDFWLKKLLDNGGDFHKAEMVKAFIAAEEYRKRFGM